MKTLVLYIGVMFILLSGIFIGGKSDATIIVFEMKPENIETIYQEIDDIMFSLESGTKVPLKLADEVIGWQEFEKKICKEGNKYQVWIENRNEKNTLIIIKK